MAKTLYCPAWNWMVVYGTWYTRFSSDPMSLCLSPHNILALQTARRTFSLFFSSSVWRQHHPSWWLSGDTPAAMWSLPFITEGVTWHSSKQTRALFSNDSVRSVLITGFRWTDRGLCSDTAWTAEVISRLVVWEHEHVQCNGRNCGDPCALLIGIVCTAEERQMMFSGLCRDAVSC
jgi:hypothetical protein